MFNPGSGPYFFLSLRMSLTMSTINSTQMIRSPNTAIMMLPPTNAVAVTTMATASNVINNSVNSIIKISLPFFIKEAVNFARRTNIKKNSSSKFIQLAVAIHLIVTYP